jgi:hypothetical protein
VKSICLLVLRTVGKKVDVMAKRDPVSRQVAAQQFWERMEQLIGKEEPFSWVARIGIKKSTFQSARERGTKPLIGTLSAWADLIGCNPDWLIDGIGHPFGQSQSQSQPQVTPTPPSPQTNPEQGQILLDVHTLEMAIHTLESVLEQTRRTMSPSKKTELILAIYQLYASTPHPTQMRPTVEILIRSAA